MITALVIHSGLPLSRFFSAGALPWCCAALSTRAHNRMAKTSAGSSKAVVGASAPPRPNSVASTSGELISKPLGVVVTDAVRRWFLETQKEAARGDVKQQALLGQMYNEGYGCEADPASAQVWIDKARRRSYRMEGVYCEL